MKISCSGYKPGAVCGDRDYRLWILKVERRLQLIVGVVRGRGDGVQWRRGDEVVQAGVRVAADEVERIWL